MSDAYQRAVRGLPPVLRTVLGPAPPRLDLDWAAVVRRLVDGAEADRTRAFFSALDAISGGPSVGLDLARHVEPAAPHSVIYLLMSAETLGEAIGLLGRFVAVMDLVTDASLGVSTSGGRATVTFGDGRHPLALTAFAAGCLLRLAAFLTGVPLVPRRVCFRAPAPRDAARFTAHLAAPVRFGHAGGDALVLSASELARPSVHANSQLREVLTRQMEGALTAAPQPDAASQVARDLEASLGRRVCDLASVAYRLRTSERTLQRRLAEAGTSFSKVLDGVRRQRALTLVSDPSLSLDAVARRAGFADYSSLYRAFVRWTGAAPQRFRDHGRHSA